MASSSSLRGRRPLFDRCLVEELGVDPIAAILLYVELKGVCYYARGVLVAVVILGLRRLTCSVQKYSSPEVDNESVMHVGRSLRVTCAAFQHKVVEI
jgi:hypothetical protein